MQYLTDRFINRIKVFARDVRTLCMLRRADTKDLSTVAAQRRFLHTAVLLKACTHEGGLSRYNHNSGDFTHYTSDENDPESITGDLVWTVMEDSRGRFWVGVANGLGILNRDSGRLVGGMNYNAAHMTKTGEAIFGGKNGLRIYQTDQMRDNPNVPEVVLTDFRMFFESVMIGAEDGLLNKSINHTALIELDYTNSVFESGVSTKETVSDISGRGVGMDAVKQFVKAKDGDKEGKGTDICLYLPLTPSEIMGHTLPNPLCQDSCRLYQILSNDK